MKHSFKILIKGLLVIVLFTGSTIVLSSAGVKTVNEANAAVSKQVVYNYLINLGYTVFSVDQIQGSTNYNCRTQLQGVSYLTTVYTDGVKIIEVTNQPM